MGKFLKVNGLLIFTFRQTDKKKLNSYYSYYSISLMQNKARNKYLASVSASTVMFVYAGSVLVAFWVFSPYMRSPSQQYKIDKMKTVGKLTAAIKNAKITHSRSSDFIACPKIQEIVNEALTYESLRAGSYTIVYGPSGIGKTELVDHTAIGKKGVVKVTLSTTSTNANVVQSLTNELLGETRSYNADFIDIDLYIETIRKCGIIPTIIFDVDCSGSNDKVLYGVRKLSKELARYCRCIIVLSDANAVLLFGIDFPSVDYIYVDEMERNEAKQLLERFNTNLTEAEMDYVFTNIGTSPLTLLLLVGRVSPTYSVNDYVAYVLRRARAQLVAFRHQPILKALKDNPEGVSPRYFRKLEDEGADLSNPLSVRPAMIAANVIVYRTELDKYVLKSTAHRTALKSYNPIIRKHFF